ncbi:MAG TPA: hypothetical protein VF712_05175 [Thermoleophilaceae bacterium]
MALSVDLDRAVEQARAEVAGMSADECIAVAAFVRGQKSILGSDRQREIAEQMALELERRASSRKST